MAYPEITFKDFSRLAKKRGWTVEMLVELFKGKTGIEDEQSRQGNIPTRRIGRYLRFSLTEVLESQKKKGDPS
jgi:hypothetical protein